jgi:hypothetical protein
MTLPQQNINPHGILGSFRTDCALLKKMSEQYRTDPDMGNIQRMLKKATSS